MEYATYELHRTSNQNCWMYGTISLNDEWLADTLEFGSKIAIPDGDYLLRVGRGSQSNSTVIEVCDNVLNVLAVFTRDCTYYHYNLKLRRESPNICIGMNNSGALLTMPDYSYKLLYMSIQDEIRIGNEPILRVSGGDNLIKY